jgi:DNA-binding NarL/FixJ family response regulator
VGLNCWSFVEYEDSTALHFARAMASDTPSSLDLLPTEPAPLRVLIVEDDPMMQLGLEQSLTAHPQITIVGQAEDGYMGVEAAMKLNPNIVVMDIGLPRLDGIAATKQIKAALPDVRVVMLTSHTTEREIIASLSSGADAYCIKGASVDRLLQAIAAAAEGATYLDPQIARQVLSISHPLRLLAMLLICHNGRWKS